MCVLCVSVCVCVCVCVSSLNNDSPSLPLLLQSRVVKQQLGERNFHVFYQVLLGAPDQLLKDTLKLTRDPTQYHYVRQGNCHKVIEGGRERERERERERRETSLHSYCRLTPLMTGKTLTMSAMQ